jgi:hypothetical protein
MCSRYITSADVSSRRSLSSGGTRHSYNTDFTASALPVAGGGDAAALSQEQAASFLDHLFDGLLSKARNQGACGSCFAYAITGAVQYATQLAYRSLGAFFDSKYMAHQYILSCIEVEGVACGCWGGDLALAMAEVAERGLVTYQQFPYENAADVVTHEGQNHVLCKANVDAGGYLGTCGPCHPGEPALELLLPEGAVEARSTSLFDAVVTCIPCDIVAGPFYHPLRPFRVYDAALPLQANVDATKRALRGFGPLATALKINQKDFARLKQSVVLANLSEAEVYRPEQTPAAGSLHAVLVVGYHDPWASSGREEDRARAVFVCRNSWGDDWGFKVRTRSIDVTQGRLAVAALETGGFFAVSMYEAVEASGLLPNAVAIRGVELRPTKALAQRSLSLEDPFLVPYPVGFLEELLSFERERAPGALTARAPLVMSFGGGGGGGGGGAALMLFLLLLCLLVVAVLV